MKKTLEVVSVKSISGKTLWEVIHAERKQTMTEPYVSDAEALEAMRDIKNSIGTENDKFADYWNWCDKSKAAVTVTGDN